MCEAFNGKRMGEAAVADIKNVRVDYVNIIDTSTSRFLGKSLAPREITIQIIGNNLTCENV